MRLPRRSPAIRLWTSITGWLQSHSQRASSTVRTFILKRAVRSRAVVGVLRSISTACWVTAPRFLATMHARASASTDLPRPRDPRRQVLEHRRRVGAADRLSVVLKQISRWSRPRWVRANRRFHRRRSRKPTSSTATRTPEHFLSPRTFSVADTIAPLITFALLDLCYRCLANP